MLPIFLTIENDEERSLAEDLYLAYKSKMYRIAYAVLHNKEDAISHLMLFSGTVLGVTGKNWNELELEWATHIKNKFKGVEIPEWISSQ